MLPNPKLALSFYIHMSLHCEISMYSVFYLCEAAAALCCHTVFVIAHLRVARPRLYHSNCPIPSNQGSRSLTVIGQFHTTVPVLSGGGIWVVAVGYLTSCQTPVP